VAGLHWTPLHGSEDRAKTSIVGLVLAAGTAIFEPALGVAKRRIGTRLGSSATAGEGNAEPAMCLPGDGSVRRTGH
jgi:hypothetical protein